MAADLRIMTIVHARAAGLLLCAAALTACAGKPESAIEEPAERSARPVAKPAPRSAADKSEIRGDIAEAAKNLQAMYSEQGAAQADPANSSTLSPFTPAPGSRPTQRPGRAIITPSAADLPPDALDPASAPSNPAPAANAAATLKTAEPERSDSQRRADAATELAAQFKPDLAAIKEPLRAALPLIALETLQPGTGAAELDKLMNAVSPRERDAIRALRDLSRTLANDPALRADPDALSRALREHADRLTAAASPGALALGTVALCQKVESYGRFTPLTASNFLAGKPIAAIVYTEVQNFTQRPTEGTDNAASHWQTELSQELQLILEADGSRQWQQPEAIIRDVTRSKRADYFLVQRIDLPRTLSVGKYTLKVIVRDKAGGAETETLIPIQIVADPSLITPNRTARPTR